MQHPLLLFTFLVLLRLVLCINIPYTSYIHPDEHFQCGEVAVQWEFEQRMRLPWEYGGKKLFRSTVAPMVQCGIPIAVLKRAWSWWLDDDQTNIPGKVLLLAIRIWGFVISLIGDVVAYVVYRRVGIEDPMQTMLLRGSSWIALVLLCRSFSNSLESFALDGLLCLALANSRSAIVAFVGGVILCFGCFCRITFPAFAFPIVLFVVWNVVEKARDGARKKNHDEKNIGYIIAGEAIRFISWSALGFLSCAVTCIVVDSSIQRDGWVLAPWNNLVYNTNVDNLAQHGLHPRWMHVMVNMQLMFGPAFLVIVVGGGTGWTKRPQHLCIAMISCALFTLSMFPHQEARFLAPLLLPVTILLWDVIKQIPSQHAKLIWVIWLIFNLASCVFWGILHQGGVVDGIVDGFSQLHGTMMPESPCLIGIGVYSIPKYWLGISRWAENVKVIDLGSSYPSNHMGFHNFTKQHGCESTFVLTTMNILKELEIAHETMAWSSMWHFNGERESGGGIALVKVLWS